MWIEAFAAHSTMVLVGIGMSTLVFACFALADQIDNRSKQAEGVRFALFRIARYLVGPACGLIVGTPVLYLLVVVRVSLGSMLTLLVAAAICTWLFVKYQQFGKVTVAP